MSKENQQPQASEEVDLGQLFKLIGNAFDRFFKFIASIFIGLYKVVLLFLIHIYKRFVWYAGAILIGTIAGFIIDMNSDKMYGANMFIETNFNSARQVYENVKQFHQLAEVDKDTVELAKRFNISPTEAAKLKGFYIEPDLDENKIAEMYSEFYLRLDSLSRATMTFDIYKASLNSFNFKVHRIGVASTDKTIYKKIEKYFTEELANNSYLEDLLEVNTQNLERRDKTLLEQVRKTDSLVDAYLTIRINESNKEPIPGSGTNLYMGDAESGNLVVDESKIIEKRLNLENQRLQVNLEKVEQQSVVNVLAGFPKTGYDISKWHEKMKFTLPIALFSLTFLLFLFFGIGNYLEKESKQQKL
ncbi:hypothetical protein V8G61_13660 [Gaetbulibacter sp. M240]|uniref:hypothetical protein n=1 Tax=Gaetbulibacter sp. M240 TaxID=3126511 RepID=UPI00374E4D09